MTDGTTPPPPDDDQPGFEPVPGYPAFPFHGAPPDRDAAVLDHATEVSLTAWQRALPAKWLPPVLCCADVGSVRLRRRDVFELAQEAHTPVGAFHTYVAAAAWGSRAGREVGRRLRAFTELPDEDRIRLDQKLADVAALLSAEGSEAAYRALVHGDQRVPHIRTSFGTKYLYFAGYQRAADGPRPLILDKSTALAVRYLTGRTCEHRQAPTAVYTAYLDRLHRWSREWDNCEPDVVERVLFAIGQAPRLAVSALSGAPYRD